MYAYYVLLSVNKDARQNKMDLDMEQKPINPAVT